MARKSKESVSWRSRIVGEGEEAPDQLLANPQNWRIHPPEQQAALEGLLSEVGWVQRVVVNRRTGHVVDGHLRVTLALRRGEPKLPVVYVDLSAEEERLILATLDPIAAMAVADQEKLGAVLAGIETENAAVRALLAKIGEDEGISPPAFAPVSIDEQGRLDQKAAVTCPECGHEFTP